MANVWTQEIVDELIESLQKVGINFSEGLTHSRLVKIEEYMGAVFPAELKLLISTMVPVSYGNDRKKFPQWTENFELEIIETQKYMEHMFTFDIEHAEYWTPAFGNKPVNQREALEQALAIVKTWPPLVRVYSHRYMPTMPNAYGNPVLSVFQAVDSIYYGKDLMDYFVNEFHIKRPQGLSDTPTEFPQVPYWGEAFELLSF